MQIRPHLGKHNDQRTSLGQVNHELGAVIVCRPRNVDCRPLLGDRPFSPEETGSIKMLVFLQQVAVRDPKDLNPECQWCS